jgi:hypothetical protein
MRRPEEVRIELPTDGDWILVKKHLNAREYRESQTRVMKPLVPGEKVELDPMKIGITLAIAYLLDWSHQDCDGHVIKIRPPASAEQVEAALFELDPEKMEEVVAAVKAHDEAMQAEREAEKKDRAGVTASSATSASAA